jgi:hypothetical protein
MGSSATGGRSRQPGQTAKLCLPEQRNSQGDEHAELGPACGWPLWIDLQAAERGTEAPLMKVAKPAAARAYNDKETGAQRL